MVNVASGIKSVSLTAIRASRERRGEIDSKNRVSDSFDFVFRRRSLFTRDASAARGDAGVSVGAARERHGGSGSQSQERGGKGRGGKAQVEAERRNAPRRKEKLSRRNTNH